MPPADGDSVAPDQRAPLQRGGVLRPEEQEGVSGAVGGADHGDHPVVGSL